MFNKLRNNYIMTNMAVISTVIITAFIIIYSITYSNSIKEKEILLSNQSRLTNSDNIKDIYLYESEFVYIFLDDKDNFVDTGSYISNTNEFIDKTINNKDYTFFRMDNKTYLSNHYLVREEFIIEEKEVHSYILYTDITALMNQLNNLLRIMIILLIIVLGIIFLICVYLANKSVAHIKEAWDKQRQFIADASHELKTPISIITSNSEALSLVSKDNKWISNIQYETSRMNTLISDLLYLSKIEDFDYSLNKDQIHFSNLLNDILLTYEVKLFEKGITLHSSIEENIIINTDEQKLKQLIHILIDNAIKYVSDKGDITINLYKEFNQLTFSVENTGKGISEDNLNRVFDRFFKEDSSRQSSKDSYGLGLAIAQAITKRMNAEIYVQSVVGEKTKFTIIFNL